jgi:hypothetical protein
MGLPPAIVPDASYISPTPNDGRECVTFGWRGAVSNRYEMPTVLYCFVCLYSTLPGKIREYLVNTVVDSKSPANRRPGRV